MFSKAETSIQCFLVDKTLSHVIMVHFKFSDNCGHSKKILNYYSLFPNEMILPSIFIMIIYKNQNWEMFATAQLHKISKMFAKCLKKCSQDSYRTLSTHFIFSEPCRYSGTGKCRMGKRFENSKSWTKTEKRDTVKTRKPSDKTLLLLMQMLWSMHRSILHCYNNILYTFFYW